MAERRRNGPRLEEVWTRDSDELQGDVSILHPSRLWPYRPYT